MRRHYSNRFTYINLLLKATSLAGLLMGSYKLHFAEEEGEA